MSLVYYRNSFSEFLFHGVHDLELFLFAPGEDYFSADEPFAFEKRLYR